MSFDFTLARLTESLARVNATNAVRSIIDILIVAYVIYKLLGIIRGTRAVSLLKGIAVIFISTMLSDLLELRTVNWLLQKTITMLFVALPIVFLPELRRALEQIGRGGMFTGPLGLLEKEDILAMISNVAKATTLLARDKIGALIVIERDTGIAELMETGTRIDAVVSTELLLNIFMPNSPLHDGAVIIRGNRIMAAGCYLPLSENQNISRRLGTRHRAALGLSEQSDAVSIVVSEETGVISMATSGKLMRYLDEGTLREKLVELLYGNRLRQSIPAWLRGHVM
ncbi:MAG: diadenylate cyclase CdaA [Bacillota bacterium]|jgi:diadenylate cyclase|nr:diadenylate cyclase CdaA [Bacillota bacterium]NLD13299.1 TIGR00159 family protein [Bacillota bacterium]HAV20871.1 TIGR00159 family protein [Bacillota bacterium]HOB87965.1 diadenylate cyclase CdaA [Bacillota bacterium]HOJ56975.1 diadenylate cyclase CdaA [Bacillota bacterium]